MKKNYLLGIFLFFLIITGVYAQTNAVKVTPDGNVGIGTDTPSEKLEVAGNLKTNGRLHDKTGIVMPVGTVIAFAGTLENIPDGWLLCDGRALERNNAQYADLFAVLGTSWGAPDADTFNVPDLRGMFLRGVAGDADTDPDKDTRSASKDGGNTGNDVGSKQEDAFQGHWHQLFGHTNDSHWWNSGQHSLINSSYNINNHVRDPISNGVNGDPRTSSETRPKNVYVYYIIKY